MRLTPSRQYFVLLALTGSVGCGTPFKSAQPSEAGAGNGGGGGTAGIGGGGSDASTTAGGSDAGPVSNIPKDGLLLWLRADEGVTVTDGYVSRWADASGQHLDATQGEAGSRPLLVAGGIGGHTAVAFDGDDDFLNLPSTAANFSQGLSIFAVVNEKTPLSYNAIIELSNGSEVDDISFGEFEDSILYEVYTNDTKGNAMLYNTPQMLGVVHRSDTTLVLRQNGQNAGAAQFALPDNLARGQNFIGHSLYSGSATFPGLIGELIVYSRPLTDAEVPVVEAELRQRWACCSP